MYAAIAGMAAGTTLFVAGYWDRLRNMLNYAKLETGIEDDEDKGEKLTILQLRQSE